MPAKSFEDIQNEYNQHVASGNPVVAGQDLGSYSQMMNGVTGSNDYAAGVGGDPVGLRSLNSAINKYVGGTGLPEITGDIGGAVGGLLGPKGATAGQEAGQALPRSLATLGIGSLLAPETGGASLLATAPFIGDSALQGYGQSGTLSGAGMGVLGAVAPLAGGVVGKALAGGAEASALRQFLGSQAGSLAGIEGVRQAEIQPGQSRNPFTPENIASDVVGLAPFVAHDLLRPGGLLNGRETGAEPPPINPVDDFIENGDKRLAIYDSNSRSVVPKPYDPNFTIGESSQSDLSQPPIIPRPQDQLEDKALSMEVVGKEGDDTRLGLPNNRLLTNGDSGRLYGKPTIDIVAEHVPDRQPVSTPNLNGYIDLPLLTDREQTTPTPEQTSQPQNGTLALTDRSDRTTQSTEGPSSVRVPLEQVERGAQTALEIVSKEPQTHEESAQKVTQLVQVAHQIDAPIPKDADDTQIAQKVQNGVGTDAEKLEDANRATASAVQDSIAREAVLRDAEEKAATKRDLTTQQRLPGLSKLTDDEAKAVADVVRQHSHKEGADTITDDIYRTASKLVAEGKIRDTKRGDASWVSEFKKSLGQAANRPRTQSHDLEKFANVEAQGEGGPIENPELTKQQAKEWQRQKSEKSLASETAKDASLDNLYTKVANDLQNPDVISRLNLKTTDPKETAARARSLVEFFSKYGSDGSALSDSEKKQAIERLRSQLGYTDSKNGRDSALKFAKENKRELVKLPSFLEHLNAPKPSRLGKKTSIEISEKELNALFDQLVGKNEPPRNVQFTAQRLFSKITKRLGLDKFTAERVTNAASRIVDNYLNATPWLKDTNFLEARGGAFEGLAHGENRRQGPKKGDRTQISLNTKAAEDKLSALSSQHPVYKAVHYLYTAGHEMWHALENAHIANKLTPRHQAVMDGMKAYAKSLNEEQKQAVMSNLMHAMGFAKYRNSLSGKARKDFENILDNLTDYASSSDSEFLASFTGMLSLGRGNGDFGIKDFRDFVDFQNKATQNFTQLAFADLTNISHLVKAWIDSTQLGLTTGARMMDVKLPNGKTISPGDFVGSLIEGYKQLTKPSERVTQAENSLVRLTSNFTQVGANSDFPGVNGLEDEFLPVAASMAAKIGMGKEKDIRESERLAGVTPGLTDRILHSNIYAQVNPLVKGVFNAVQNFRPMAHGIYKDIAAPIFGDTRNSFKNVASNQSARGALNVLRRAQNENRNQVLDDARIKAELDKTGLSESLKADVKSVFKGALQVGANAREHLKTKLDETFRNYLTSIIRTGTEHTQDKVEALGRTAAQLAQSGQVDPRQLAMLDAAIGNPETSLRLTSAVQQLLPELNKAKATLDSQPGYIPESRPGPYSVRYTVNGVEHFDGFSSVDTFDKFVAAKRNEKGTEVLQTYKKGDTPGLESLSQKNLEALQGMETALYKHALSNLPADVRESIMKDYTPLEDLRKEMLSSSYRKYAASREGVPEQALDTLESVLNYARSVSNGVARQSARELSNIRLADPDLQKSPDLAKRAQDQVDFVLSSNDGKNSSYLRQAIATYFQGLNPVSAMMYAIQPLQTLSPYLTKNGDTLAKSYGRIVTALQDVVKGHTSGVFGDEETNAAFARAEKEGHLESTIADQWDDSRDAVAASFLNNAETNIDRAKLWSNRAWQTMQLSRVMHTAIYRLNNEIAFLSTYRQALDKGLSGEQAYQYAVQGKSLTMLTGGRENRPALFQSTDNGVNSALSVALTMSNYMNGLLSTYKWYFNDAIGKSGLKGAELASARKAFGQLLGTQALLAGVVGLPLVGGTMSLIQQLFPQLQLKKDLQEGIAALAGDDHELGDTLSNYAMRGLTSNLLGVDVSSRMGLGGYLGLEQDDGFNLSSFLGPGGSVLENFVKAGQDASVGQYSQTAQDLMPSFLKQIVNAAKDDGNVYSKSGELLMKPTATQNMLRAIGLKPAELSRLQQQAEYQREGDAAAKLQSQAFVENMAQELAQGNSIKVRQALFDRKAADSNFDIPETLNAIAQRAVERQIPYDPLRDSSSKTNWLDQQQVARLYAQSAQQPTEVQRLTATKAMEQSVGITGVGQVSPQALTRASMIDQVMRMSPTMPRGMAAHMVDNILHSRRQETTQPAY